MLQPLAFLFVPWVLLLHEGGILTTAVNHPLLSLLKPKVPRGGLLPPWAQRGAASTAARMASLWARAKLWGDSQREGAALQPESSGGSSEDKLHVWCSLETRVSHSAQPRLFPTEEVSASEAVAPASNSPPARTLVCLTSPAHPRRASVLCTRQPAGIKPTPGRGGGLL